MAYNLTYNDLSENIDEWQGFPLSLSGDEVMPLDYRAGRTGWLLYGKHLNKTTLSEFQLKLAKPLVIVSAWKVKSYQIIHVAGELTKKTKNLAEKFEFDFAAIEHVPSLRSPGLLVMDMDSTAIEIECIDEIAKLAGCGEQVSAVTEQAMRGELDFSASLRKRVAALKDADAAILENIKDNLPLTAGLTHLVRELRRYNWHVAIASGGFTYFAEYLQQKLKLTAIAANELEIKNDKLTGRVVGTIVDAKVKAQFLQDLADKLGISKAQTVAIGDGANDLRMLHTAELGIAYHAKPKVVEKSQVNIRFANLIGVLCILSVSLNNER